MWVYFLVIASKKHIYMIIFPKDYLPLHCFFWQILIDLEDDSIMEYRFKPRCFFFFNFFPLSSSSSSSSSSSFFFFPLFLFYLLLLCNVLEEKEKNCVQATLYICVCVCVYIYIYISIYSIYAGDTVLIPGVRRSPGGEYGNSL